MEAEDGRRLQLPATEGAGMLGAGQQGRGSSFAARATVTGGSAQPLCGVGGKRQRDEQPASEDGCRRLRKQPQRIQNAARQAGMPVAAQRSPAPRPFSGKVYTRVRGHCRQHGCQRRADAATEAEAPSHGSQPAQSQCH